MTGPTPKPKPKSNFTLKLDRIVITSLPLTINSPSLPSTVNMSRTTEGEVKKERFDGSKGTKSK